MGQCHNVWQTYNIAGHRTKNEMQTKKNTGIGQLNLAYQNISNCIAFAMQYSLY